MQKKLIDSIQNDFFKLTNKKLSKKQIEKKILPIFFFIYNSKRKKFLISGSQGIGKTTIEKINQASHTMNVNCMNVINDLNNLKIGLKQKKGLKEFYDLISLYSDRSLKVLVNGRSRRD